MVCTSGCARTQGFYRLDTSQRFRRSWCVGRSVVSDVGGERQPLPLIPATVEMQINAQCGASFGWGPKEELAEELTELATVAKRKKVTQAREVRSDQRRLLNEFQAYETGDLLKFNQLKVNSQFFL